MTPEQKAEAWVISTTEAARRAKEDAKNFGHGFMMVDSSGNWVRIDPWRISLREET